MLRKLFAPLMLLILVVSMSSCFVAYPRGGYYHPHRYHHPHHYRGW